MAKRKTPKSEKIVDLKPKAEKVTEEQLTKMQNIVNAINQGQQELGRLELQKSQMVTRVMSFQEAIGHLQKELEEEYGQVDINIQDGTIKYQEDVKTDTKD
jgi:hypothetical protein